MSHSRTNSSVRLVAVIGLSLVGCDVPPSEEDASPEPGFRQPTAAELVERLPELDEPFDVAAFSDLRVAPDRNAFVEYERATESYVAPSAEVRANLDDVLANGRWESATPPLVRWLRDNEEALRSWSRGADRREAVDGSPGRRVTSGRSPFLDLVSDFGRLARCRAVEELAEDRPGEAWGPLRSLCFASRHPGAYGRYSDREIGYAMVRDSTPQITAWARHPAVDAALLRAAMEDVQSTIERTAPLSNAVKVEYLVVRHAIENSSPLEFVIGEPLPERFQSEFTVLEPVVSRRVSRALFANWLEWVDAPVVERPFRIIRREGLDAFADNADRRVLEQDDARMQLLQWAALRSVYCCRTTPLWRVMAARDADVVQLQFLRVLFATEIALRETGAVPETLDGLRLHGLEPLPTDPFDSHGGPLHFEYDGHELLVASVGRDGRLRNGEGDDVVVRTALAVAAR